jgi:deazaflavin-dependent oxidoreductase (nitroreductase family)
MEKADFDKFNAGVVDEFRAKEGKVGGMFTNFPMILVHHKGAKSGTERVSPLVYTKDGDDFVIIASRGGTPKHPDWYHNLIAHPDTKIEVGTETHLVRVVEAQGDDRKRLFDAQAEMMPNFKDYEKATAGIREIPVLRLKPR